MFRLREGSSVNELGARVVKARAPHEPKPIHQNETDMNHLPDYIKRVVVLDAETYFDNEYSLRRMRTHQYIADERFSLHGWAVQLDDSDTAWFDEPARITSLLHGIDWSETALCGHNLMFDGNILAYRYGVVPRLYLDTLSMARVLIRPFTGSVSLASCGNYLMEQQHQAKFSDLSKGNALLSVKGLRYHEMSDHQKYELGKYARQDVQITHALLDYLLPWFNEQELHLLDRTIRMYVQPQLRLNGALLRRHLNSLQTMKANILKTARVSETDLMSNPKFATVLEGLGVDPPMKTSPTTGKRTYAFAKTDEGLRDLLEHENPLVQGLVAARIGVKSTIEETRTETLLDIANNENLLRVPLNYAGAHTTRMSGAGGLNLQNLPRGSALRDAIEAPKKKKLVVADAAQIEARVLAKVAGQKNKVLQFARGEDVYSRTAEGIYRLPFGSVSKEAKPFERNVGKVGDLSLGYGSGPPTFRSMCRNSKIVLNPDEASAIVRAWRGLNSNIVDFWHDLYDRFRSVAASKVDRTMDVRGYAIIGKDVARDATYIESPNGLRVWYPKCRVDTDKFGDHGFGYQKSGRGGGYFKRTWGGELTNNLIQFLAREITMYHAAILSRPAKMYFALQVHDELVFVVPDDLVDKAVRACEIVMSTPPAWAAGIPLAVEVATGQTYGECK